MGEGEGGPFQFCSDWHIHFVYFDFQEDPAE